MFIGLVIGVLGVTVLLLVVTVLIMYRKNKQKVFNKHSIFKSQLSATTHNGMTGPRGLGVGMNPTSHVLRDLQGGMGGGNSGNGSTTNTGSSNGGPGKVRVFCEDIFLSKGIFNHSMEFCKVNRNKGVVLKT